MHYLYSFFDAEYFSRGIGYVDISQDKKYIFDCHHKL